MHEGMRLHTTFWLESLNVEYRLEGQVVGCVDVNWFHVLQEMIRRRLCTFGLHKGRDSVDDWSGSTAARLCLSCPSVRIVTL
jgi:hypothetical protein